MDYDKIRKQKIDKTYIDEAFKEIPMYESMAVSSEKESYRLAKELLAMGHVNSQPAPKLTLENRTEPSPPTLQSFYFSPEKTVPVENNIYMSEERPTKANQPGSLAQDMGRADFNSGYSSERNVVPHSLREKPIDSPSRLRESDNQGGFQDTSSKFLGKAQSFAVKHDPLAEAPPTWDDINEFKGKYSEVKRIIMQALIEDLQKKENDYYVINSLRAEKDLEVYPRKIFLLFGAQEDILDSKSPQYRVNQEIVRSKLSYYYETELSKHHEGHNKKPLLYLYLIYQRGKTWEYVKVVMEGTRNTGVFYRYSQYNPSYFLESFSNDVLDKYIENILKPLIAPMPVLKKNNQHSQKKTRTQGDGSICSIWDSGIEVYKRLAKDYIKLSQEKVSREQLFYLLLEKFYANQLAE